MMTVILRKAQTSQMMMMMTTTTVAVAAATTTVAVAAATTTVVMMTTVVLEVLPELKVSSSETVVGKGILIPQRRTWRTTTTRPLARARARAKKSLGRPTLFSRMTWTSL